MAQLQWCDARARLHRPCCQLPHVPARRAPRAAPFPRAPQSHTIILLQTADDSNSRTYLDFARPAQAWDAITRMFEERLKVISPGVKTLSYDVQDLFRWLDNLADVSCLVCVAARRRVNARRRCRRGT